MRRASGVLFFIAVCFVCSSNVAFAGVPSEYDFESVAASLSDLRAGAHPDFTTTIQFKQDPDKPAEGLSGLHPLFGHTKDVVVKTPPGLGGNPNAVSQCEASNFAGALDSADKEGGCPLSSQVGIATVDTTNNGVNVVEPIYVLAPPERGDVVARLAFWAVLYPIYIDIKVRSESDYGLTAEVENVPAAANVVRSVVTIWGIPAAKSHDTLRMTPAEVIAENLKESPPRSTGLSPKPFFTNPTSCGPLQVGVESDTYELPGYFAKAVAGAGAIVGCEDLNFSPSLTVTPTSHITSSPSGLNVKLSIPQVETANTLATSQLRNSTVRLPQGMTAAPGAADGLMACDDAEAAYLTREAAHCPEPAKIGSATFVVPALQRPLMGAVYLRRPISGDLFRIWLLADELGVHVKIPGDLKLDPVTGQITSLFIDNPQVPVESIELHINGGARGSLATPSSCGVFQTHYLLTPWSGGIPSEGDTPMSIDGGCTEEAFAPGFEAGSIDDSAGAFTTAVAEITREAHQDNLSRVSVSLPRGVLAKLAGVEICENITANSADCPVGSRVGTVATAVGPGSSPLWIPQPGRSPTAVYLAGPYKGAPYSLVIVVPAEAGPFDLGNVTTRAAVDIDPNSAVVSINSDPLPQILQGVPVSYRHIHVEVNRPDFVLNPTGCNQRESTAQFVSLGGKLSGAHSVFSVTGCRSLGFRPRFRLNLNGPTRRGGFPRLSTVLRPRAGDSNFSRVVVALPHSEFLEQGHIKTICTRVQFSSSSCPAGSIYGHARVSTPLLSRPLRGPIYLRSSSNTLPDLVLALRGQVDLNLVGRIDSINGGIRATFNNVPDAPFSKAVVSMRGGSKSLLVNSRELCALPARAKTLFSAQNGAKITAAPMLHAACG